MQWQPGQHRANYEVQAISATMFSHWGRGNAPATNGSRSGQALIGGRGDFDRGLLGLAAPPATAPRAAVVS
jgi:hypothetical protein